MLQIINARIMPMRGETLENGQLLIDGGKIKVVGTRMATPAGTEVLDAGGRLVTPGLVDAHCHIGVENSCISGAMGRDCNECSDPATPQVRAIDSIYPQDSSLREALAAGVTTAVTGPGSGNVIGGTFAAVKLHGMRVDDMVIRQSVAMKVAFGENPKNVYGMKGNLPMTRMGTASILREYLGKARRYMEDMEAGRHPAYFSRRQAEIFRRVVEDLQNRGLELGKIHLLSSYAAVNYPEYAYDYARLGILMFGVKSSPGDYLRRDLDPRPVMTLKAHITSVREIGPGESVSYGRVFRAEKPTKIASVAIGYADGIPRCLSGGKLRAIVRGQYVHGAGRICMDQLMLDVTGVEDVQTGDEAVFIGRESGAVIYAEELAENSGSITNELFSRLGARLEGRQYTT